MLQLNITNVTTKHFKKICQKEVKISIITIFAQRAKTPWPKPSTVAKSCSA